MRRWLVPHDLLPHSNATASLAVREVALMGGGSIVLAHVGLPVSLPLPPGVGGLRPQPSALHPLEAQQYLETLLGALRRAHPEVAVEIRNPEGGTADELLRLVERESIDRIVMASESRSAISRFFLGSVSDDIVHKSPVPVLIVKRPLCGAEVEIAPDLETT